VADVKTTLEEFPMFDTAILRHGFTPFMRDYQVLTEVSWERLKGQFLYRFTHCPVAQVETRVRDDVWRSSWGDEFTEYSAWQAAGEPEGFVWGVEHSVAYPGLKLEKRSSLAAQWSKRLGREMHDVTVETEAFHLRLVFHDLVVRKVGDDTSLIERLFIKLRA
jgi:hypothetical protein